MNMEKKYFMMAALATMMAACSNEAEPLQEAAEMAQANTQAEQTPVVFDAYVNRATTRDVMYGALASTNLPTQGFGVFAYYTDDDLYSPIYQPNFMYNMQVKGSGSPTSWSYTPVRYWPNETGGNNNGGGVDRLTFFAYAPWVQVTPTTGIVTETDRTTGIIGLSRNGAVGDPFVKYYVNLDPSKQIDFCYGVAAEALTNSVAGSSTNKVDKDAPFVNVIKPVLTSSASTPIKFDFKHALAALNVQVDAKIDALPSGTNGTLANDTKIYIRQITFEGFVMQGSFNLNATVSNPRWYDLAGSSYINGGSVTIYDGRTDGREAVSAAVNETPTGLNEALVQSAAYDSSPKNGVTTTAVSLFNKSNSSDTNNNIYVIPTGQPLKVTIVYDVETKDESMSTYLSDSKTPGVSVQNTITQSITISADNNKLVAGKAYTLNLHLGMESVTFSASVTDWPDATSISGNLPANAQ